MIKGLTLIYELLTLIDKCINWLLKCEMNTQRVNLFYIAEDADM